MVQSTSVRTETNNFNAAIWLQHWDLAFLERKNVGPVSWFFCLHASCLTWSIFEAAECRDLQHFWSCGIWLGVLWRSLRVPTRSILGAGVFLLQEAEADKLERSGFEHLVVFGFESCGSWSVSAWSVFECFGLTILAAGVFRIEAYWLCQRQEFRKLEFSDLYCFLIISGVSIWSKLKVRFDLDCFKPEALDEWRDMEFFDVKYSTLLERPWVFGVCWSARAG